MRQNKKFIVVAGILIVIVCIFVIWKLHGTPAPVAPQANDTSVWKTYTDQMTGFTIKYPPQYEASGKFNNTPEWGSSNFVSISDPTDTSNYEFHVGVMSSVLQKQPITASGKIY